MNTDKITGYTIRKKKDNSTYLVWPFYVIKRSTFFTRVNWRISWIEKSTNFVVATPTSRVTKTKPHTKKSVLECTMGLEGTYPQEETRNRSFSLTSFTCLGFCNVFSECFFGRKMVKKGRWSKAFDPHRCDGLNTLNPISSQLSFFRSETELFLNDRKKLSQFGYNVPKYRLVNTVTASFITVVGKMTQISQRKKKQSIN